jgi:hypothetical protein
MDVKLGVIFGEEHRFRLSENKLPRGTLGAKRKDVTGNWRKMDDTRCFKICTPPNIIKI